MRISEYVGLFSCKGLTFECNLQLHLQLKLLSVYTLQIMFHEKKKLKRQESNKTEIVAQKASFLLRLLHT